MALYLKVDGIIFLGIKGLSLLECFRKAGCSPPSSCHGRGQCRECRIVVGSGEDLLSPRTALERYLPPGQRLACQAIIAREDGAIECFTPASGSWRIEGLGRKNTGTVFPLDPAVKVVSGQVLVEGRKAGNFHGKILGIALDIGTSTVVMRVIDLLTGMVEASTAFINPQLFAGSDVMSRVSYASEKGQKVLQQAVASRINRFLEEEVPDRDQIYEIVVAGNPVMRDLFLGIDVSGLGQGPFYSLLEDAMRKGRRDSTSIYQDPGASGLRINSEGRVYGLPFLGCHVGGDISAGILASGMAWETKNSAFLDLGTNSEIVIRNRSLTVAASCPAGPAFEGGLIKSGMPGVDGAIEAVRILPDGTMACKVIGNTAPVGFCGSGLLSLLGELLGSGLITKLGRISRETGSAEELSRRRMEESAAGKDASSEPGPDRWLEEPAWPYQIKIEKGSPGRFFLPDLPEIFIDEEDISNLLQAKAAINAGLKIAFRKLGMDPGSLDHFYLAGAFGRYLELASAVDIGLLPALERGRFIRMGNASIEGASMALLSLPARSRLEETVSRITHLELESETDFFALYADGCLLEKM